MLSNCGAGEDSESSLDSKEIKSVNPKGNQHIDWTNAENEAPIIFPPELTHWKKKQNKTKQNFMLTNIEGRRSRE